MKKLLPIIAGSLLMPLLGMLLLKLLQAVGVVGPEGTAFIEHNALYIGLVAIGVTLPFAYFSWRKARAKRDQ
jgi:hypothetical protein